MEQALREAVTAAAGRDEACDAVGAVYADVRAAVDARNPPCALSGRCCRFEEYGHRLYVTTLELAAFVKQLPVVGCQLPAKSSGTALAVLADTPLATSDRQLATAPWDGTGCPFQVSKLCTVHAARPFGCRMFFCDPGTTDWQNEAYERFHGRLKALHERFAVPYFYVEWRQALRALGLAAPPVSAGEDSF